jgi:hypothetical protein
MLRILAIGAIAALLQPAASLTTEQLLARIGVPAGDVTRLAAGETMIWKIPGNVPAEVAAAGAIRAKGDLRRLIAWLRDIEAFMKAAGTKNVGVIAEPVVAGDFAMVDLAGIDISREKLHEYVTAYQQGRLTANQAEFEDLLNRSTKVWDLARPFVSYLSSYPAAKPDGTENRFYWTRDTAGRNPVLTLHHVTLQEFADGRVLVADKQFYASRQIDAALMIALGIPAADKTGFDLIVSVKGRSGAIGGVGGRVLRGRIESELADGLKTYLEWIRASSAL